MDPQSDVNVLPRLQFKAATIWRNIAAMRLGATNDAGRDLSGRFRTASGLLKQPLKGEVLV
ncbi:hypothetical protein GDI0761 [Gluconacetobacter diazotrophicus PA1 5]|uniref:Uncharacterized protein n=2 Tax=Gluconacetobacter diazotrophicus TaxID=33996 RepID=A9HAK1_GLUDA|nr:hypothetical protein GDI0761 [Gluconacetobacter diazotrophicus PA1 5]